MKTANRYINELQNLKESNNYRILPDKNANTLIDLCSNDYLGLNNNEELYQEFIKEFQYKNLKFSASSSRLLSGNSPEYNELEQLIASRYKRESCLLFNSGYHANIGILPSLADNNDLIIADKLVHASIIDGAKLSNAKLIRYKHLDYVHLEKLLEKHRSDYEHVFIVSESIFSMDGDVADLQKLVEIKLKYECLLYIDEAHAVGAIGKKGLGCVEEEDVIDAVDFIVGTFGKALASVGAFVVCDLIYKDYLINKSRSLIFTTALPPINLAWSKFIFERLPEFDKNRKLLKSIAEQMAQLLNTKAESHIIPQIIGSNNNAIEVSNKLKQIGFNVLPIRYPTVPKDTARLRFSLNTNLNIEQLKPIKQVLETYER